MAISFQVDTAGTLMTGLLGYYKLDSNSSDYLGVINGTDTSVSYGTGKVGNAATYNGSSSKTDLGANYSFERTDSFSVAFWVKTASANNDFWIGKISTLGHTAPGWVIQTVGGRIYLQLNSGPNPGNNEMQVNSTYNTINNNTWHHVIVTYNGNSNASGVTFTVDGSASANFGVDFNSLSATIINSVNARFAATSADTSLMNGSLDEIGIWNKVLSAQEKTDLWNSGNGQTITGSSNTSQFFQLFN